MPDLPEKVFSQLQLLVHDHIIPGFSAAVLQRQEVTVQTFGDKQWLPVKKPLTPGLAYDLASLTKVIGTTTVFLQTLAKGAVSLDQPLHAFLPDFPWATTFRQALTHTSGLEGYIPHRNDLPAKALQQALLTQLHVTAEADTQVVYRDYNLLLVGWALETIYHQPIQDLIQQNVLKPLHLAGASFDPEPKDCVPTTYDPQTGLKCGVVHDPKAAILKAHCGSAGLFATLADMIAFVQYAFGQRQCAAWPAGFAQLTQDFTKSHLKRSLGWDLRQNQKGIWLYHTGYTGTWLLMQPKAKLAMIVLSNRVHPTVNADFLARRDQIVAQFLKEPETN